MQQFFSPKQVAAAIGVSESSLKRWCDQGSIPTSKTPGGHRKIRLGDVVHLVRTGKYRIVKPELLGLTDELSDDIDPQSVERSTELLVGALKEGDAHRCRQIIIDNYVKGTSVLVICDQIIADAMRAIGDGWQCGDVEIFQEHRACEIVNNVLYDLKLMTHQPDEGSPLAMGATPAGDFYRIPTMTVEMVLNDLGWQTASLGTSLPFCTLLTAIKRHRPELFWLSVSHCDHPEALLADLADFAQEVPSQTTLVIGGQAISDLDFTHIPGLKVAENLVDLERISQERLEKQKVAS